MGEQNGHSDVEKARPPKKFGKLGDLFADRIVAIVGGALIPIILLLIPLVNKYLDNDKEIQTLQIQSNADDLAVVQNRVQFLMESWMVDRYKLAEAVKSLTEATSKLTDCQKNIEGKK